MKVRSTTLLLSGMLLVSLVPASLALEASQAGMEPPKLRVLLGKSLIVNSDEPLRRVSVSNPQVASAIIITEKQVLIHGLRAGIVSLILWTQEEQPRTLTSKCFSIWREPEKSSRELFRTSRLRSVRQGVLWF